MEISFPKKDGALLKKEEITPRIKTLALEEKGDYLLVIKHLFKLFHYQDGKQIAEYFVAIGLNPGDKEEVGDFRTPLGLFPVVKIEDSSNWEHDFSDGKGSIKNAYGPWFIRLLTNEKTTISGKKWTGIGIHGTHNPNSIGKRATEGCIRLRNEDLVKLVQSLPENGQRTLVEIVE
ncbi:MAG: L,D-transpeptidase [Candidatus Cloacimonetes bacterium]|nr:L,D-transpeptidase [Candidatus Cloacimonadota bacterium]